MFRFLNSKRDDALAVIMTRALEEGFNSDIQVLGVCAGTLSRLCSPQQP
jgi:hypothetical protein